MRRLVIRRSIGVVLREGLGVLRAGVHTRCVRVAVTGMLLAAAVPVAATAAPAIPKEEPVVVLEAPAREVCDFPIRLTVIDGTRSHDVPGAVLVTGSFRVTVENLETGTKETFNASGPTLVDRSSGNVVLTGPAVIVQRASRDLGAPFLILNRGRTEFALNNTILSMTGTTTDLCAAVA